MKQKIPVGILFSTGGPYSIVGTALLQGTTLAVEEINADPTFSFTLEPVVRDPGGELGKYASMCEELVREHNIAHIVGCYTSVSRKEIIPIVEKYDAILWYPSHYEGFECSPNVVYAGAAPNQHVVPLASYLLNHYGKRVYCVGSNYIWPWECTRIFREVTCAQGGTILQERYISLGNTDVERVLDEIEKLRPDVIFNTLIGNSSYAFYRALGKRRQEGENSFLLNVPVASCTLSEPELLAIGEPFASGHLTGSVYLQSIDTPRNAQFVRAFKQKFGLNTVTSADAEAAYISVHVLARAIRSAGSTHYEDVKGAARGLSFEAPQGLVTVDAENDHLFLTPRIGRSVEGGKFEILATATSPVKPDPYLLSSDRVGARATLGAP